MKKSHIGMLQILICAVLWSTAGMFVKLLPWNSLGIIGVRSIFTLTTLIVYMALTKQEFVINKRTVLIGFAILGMCSMFISANKLTTAANAIVLQYAAPIYVLIATSVISKTRIKKAEAVASVFAVLGIAVFFLDQLGAGAALGNIFAIVAGMFFAAMFVLSVGITTNERMSGILIGQVLAIIVGLPFMFIYKERVEPIQILYVALFGIFQLGIPYILYAFAMRNCSALTCSLISVAEPLLSPLWVFLVFGERLSIFALMGGVIVIVSVVGLCVYNERNENAAAGGKKAANVIGIINSGNESGIGDLNA